MSSTSGARRARLWPGFLAFAAAFAVSPMWSASRSPDEGGSVGTGVAWAATDTSVVEDARIVHLLSRAAYGPTPELVDEVRSVGRTAWIERQLDPGSIDDPELEDRLAVYTTLELSSGELRERYPKPEPGAPRDPLTGPNRPLGELMAARLTRAVHAKAQLAEVLTDFWLNHFSVYAPEDPTRWAITAYERDAIRPRVLGRFEDLLRATAESPAMLRYLDNYVSAVEGARGAGTGINENYARELMELHTVGVDGGYTQADVVQVARAFTGWAITPLRTGLLEFLFRPRWHDRSRKTVLGVALQGKYKAEGDEVLHLLADHPATADFVARKLAAYFTSDAPPESLVEDAAQKFRDTRGDLATVVRTILTSAELDAPESRGAKIKAPLELVASALRASGSSVDLGFAAARLVGTLGQPLYQAHPPTGWPEVATALVSAGGMLARFDAAARVAAGRVVGVRTDVPRWERILGPKRDTAALAQEILCREPGADTAAALAEAAAGGASPVALAALVLASPEFQEQ